jgi:hypothetical protein
MEKRLAAVAVLEGIGATCRVKHRAATPPVRLILRCPTHLQLTCKWAVVERVGATQKEARAETAHSGVLRRSAAAAVVALPEDRILVVPEEVAAMIREVRRERSLRV